MDAQVEKLCRTAIALTQTGKGHVEKWPRESGCTQRVANHFHLHLHRSTVALDFIRPLPTAGHMQPAVIIGYF